MKTNLDDPRLTAYALNELDEAGKMEVEKILAADPAARQWVEDMRQTALKLETELQDEKCPALTFQQTKAIEKKLGAENPAEKINWWQRQWFPGFRLLETFALIALLAVLAALLLPSLAKTKNKSRRIALLNGQHQMDLEKQTTKDVAANAPVNLPANAKKSETSTMSAAPVSALPAMPPGEIPQQNVALALPTSSSAPHLQVNGVIAGNSAVAVASDTSKSGFKNSYGSTVYSRKNLSQDELQAYQKVSLKTRSLRFRNLAKVSGGEFNTEAYASLPDNSFLSATENPLSTFSIDVDTASYANVRRFLNENQLPPPDAVRIEEMVNYFSYHYPPPKGDAPFSVNAEVASCPWNSEHRLVRIGLKGREIARNHRPPSNLVFLIDVSGSMDEPDKLPLLKESLKLLTRQLTENDHVSIVVYAGAAGMVLPETSGGDKATILDALNRLQAGGSTHGSAGIQLAYETAAENFIADGVNRVILCTDGDFNVGITSQGDLARLIQEQAKSKIFLSVLGFGTGNYKDSTMEMLADKGNGNYAYIDSLNEGRKILVEQMSGTLVTIAKDVKIQIEFNPAQVDRYRLIGYENRLLAKEDFNNDKKDAGEIGAGHTVTALYEIVPAGMSPDETADVDPLKYQKPAKPAAASDRDELLTLKLRYKQPDGDTSRLLTTVVKDSDKNYARASTDFKFAAAVAEFGMILRDSPYKGDATLSNVWEHTKAGLGDDPEGYRAEFLTLIEEAQRLSRNKKD